MSTAGPRRDLTLSLVLFLLTVTTVSVMSSSVEAFAQSESQTTRLAEAAKGILEKNCLSCHGELQISGLDMRRREALLEGGKRGPAVVPGKAEESLLYLAASHSGELKMPPKKPPLAAEELAILRRWINLGADWPVPNAPETGKTEASWWSFRKPRRPSVPAVKNSQWVRNPIDAFILAKLEERGLIPAPAADKLTLIRRAYFDLVGLPPPPSRVESFVKDPAPNSYEKLVDELLSSPRYGERWGRHWLDLARYADSGGYGNDLYYRNAWRYRDYVIKSFNEDKPYDRFIQEQIAGDLLWRDDLDLDGSLSISAEKLQNLEARIGTGLFALGPQVHESNIDHKRLSYETLTDWVDTTGAVFLGLSLGCARCHDHKFDPISQRDYYRFQAVFAGSREIEIPIVSPMSIADRKFFYPKIITLEEARIAYRLFEKAVRDRVLEEKKKEFPPDVVRAFEIPVDRQTLEEKRLAARLIEAVNSIKTEEVLTPDEKKKRQELFEKLARAAIDLPQQDLQDVPFDAMMEPPSASVIAELEPELIPPVFILNRGELTQPSERVAPGLPTMVAQETEPEKFAGSFEARKKLALWLTQPDHPLTVRVMVNRLWLWHFGRGIVATPNDFGLQGEEPSHPALLDWLATEFVSRGWSIKSMHRLIMLSSAYQMSSTYADQKNATSDPENRFVWRMNRRRLEGESLWDSMHAVGGTLNLKMGGRPVVPPLGEDEFGAIGRVWHWPVSSDPAEYHRRGIYILSRRNFVFPMFETFDAPDSSGSCPERKVTTVPTQALWFLNNRAVLRVAQEFATRLAREGGADPREWVRLAWPIALSREISAREENEALAMLDSLAGAQGEAWPELPAELRHLPPGRAGGLIKLCLAIFNLNEFVFVD